MSVGTHTPGPWRWDTSCGAARLIQAETRAPVLIALPGICAALPTVAVNTQQWAGPPYELREATPIDANARLIAAAPDLLAACEEALPIAQRMRDVLANVHDGYPDELRRADARLARLRAVIANAKGGARLAHDPQTN